MVVSEVGLLRTVLGSPADYRLPHIPAQRESLLHFEHGVDAGIEGRYSGVRRLVRKPDRIRWE